MTNEEIRATFLGQTVSKYDGWNGSEEIILVTDVKMDVNSVALYGEQVNRNYTPFIYIHRDIVERLIIDGKYVSHQEIDHCPYDVTISILPTKQQTFERRIENLKADIKHLKQELKQAQKDYMNFLHSTITIRDIRKHNELNM